MTRAKGASREGASREGASREGASREGASREGASREGASRERRFTYAHPRPALTVDAVVLAFDAGRLSVLLVKRGLPPFEGAWALPGGFVHVDETLDRAVRRELAEETGLTDVYLEELKTFSRVDRDPRERVISVAFVALVRGRSTRIHEGSDAAEARWFALEALPPLAFDHAEILEAARERLRARVRTRPVGFELLPERFPLRALQELYEAVLGVSLDKRNFRKRVLALDVLEPTGELEASVAHRAAALYRFDEKRYRRLERSGFVFEI
ncbi:MAG: NUDIX domain-containing protein [Sandaracinus sp.]